MYFTGEKYTEKNENEIKFEKLTAVTDNDSLTLEDYLSKLYCTACPKHCPLSSPRCGRGEQQALKAEQAYYQSHNSTASSSESSIAENSLPVSEDSAIQSNEKDSSSTSSSGSENSTVSSSSASQDEESLEDYLSKLYCTACPKHCPLSNPQCGRGELQAQQAEQEYYATKNTSSSSTSENASSQNNPLAPFAEFTPIMGLFIGGTHYTLEFIRKIKG